MPPKLNAAQRAARADALMLELRQIGYLPRATDSSTGQRLVMALRRARAAGDMDAYESELESLAARERGGAAKHAEEAVAAAAVCPSVAASAAKQMPSAAERGEEALAAEQCHPEANAAMVLAEQHKREVPAAVCPPQLASAAEHRQPMLRDGEEISRHFRMLLVNAGPVSVRIVDHASASSESVSDRVARICRSAGLLVFAELSCDQAMDACGYIAADAVVELRNAALAKPNGWETSALPEYASLAVIRRGEAALQRHDAERVLDVADVNALVRRYSHLDERAEAHEEWWGGAVSLDNFLDGSLIDFLGSLAHQQQAQHQHRWRAWVVNTQCSWQQGSHWFTVVAGLRLNAPESLLPQPVAKRLRGAAAYPPSRRTPRSKLGSSAVATVPACVAEQQSRESCAAASSAMPAAEQLQSETNPRGYIPDGRHEANAYPALFPTPSAALVQAIKLASESSHVGPAATKIKRACEEWNAALADGTLTTRQKRRKLCQDHNIVCSRDMKAKSEIAAHMARDNLAQRLRSWRADRAL